MTRARALSDFSGSKIIVADRVTRYIGGDSVIRINDDAGKIKV